MSKKKAKAFKRKKTLITSLTLIEWIRSKSKQIIRITRIAVKSIHSRHIHGLKNDVDNNIDKNINIDNE